MTMTKRDFEEIAEAMRNARGAITMDSADILRLRILGIPPVRILEAFDRYFLNALTDALASTNPKFSRAMFNEACGKEY